MNHIYAGIQGWFNFHELYNHIIDMMPDNFIFAEIGSWKGRSLSYFVIESINRKKTGTIYAIDHWQGSPEHYDPSNPAYEYGLQNNPDWLFDQFKNNTSSISSYIIPLRETSTRASIMFDDNSIDAVFIDASHEYEDVLHDLIAWQPKIKSNGILCGHDYDWPGVKKAVDEFSRERMMKASPISQTCWIIK
jgi:hypothetical protein